jgi:hypothetical protein
MSASLMVGGSRSRKHNHPFAITNFKGALIQARAVVNYMVVGVALVNQDGYCTETSLITRLPTLWSEGLDLRTDGGIYTCSLSWAPS